MIRFTKKDVRYFIMCAAMLGFLGTLVVFCHRPATDTGFEKQKTSAADLHLSRQVLWVNADSLRMLIDDIQQNEPGAFSIKTASSEWEIAGENKKAFERIFLDGEPLSNWNTEKYPSIRKTSDNSGFSLITKEIHGIKYVQIPAEIIQSLQLAYQL